MLDFTYCIQSISGCVCVAKYSRGNAFLTFLKLTILGRSRGYFERGCSAMNSARRPEAAYVTRQVVQGRGGRAVKANALTMKACRVNSPAWANRTPGMAVRAVSSDLTTAGPPCPCSSTTSSPVPTTAIRLEPLLGNILPPPPLCFPTFSLFNLLKRGLLLQLRPVRMVGMERCEWKNSQSQTLASTEIAAI